MKLLPDTYGQAAQMTICESPDTNAEEVGHWYSPARVKALIAMEREACAKVCEAQEQDDCDGEFNVYKECANAIRNRK